MEQTKKQEIQLIRRHFIWFFFINNNNYYWWKNISRKSFSFSRKFLISGIALLVFLFSIFNFKFWKEIFKINQFSLPFSLSHPLFFWFKSPERQNKSWNRISCWTFFWLQKNLIEIFCLTFKVSIMKWKNQENLFFGSIHWEKP